MKNMVLGATLALGVALFTQQASAISFNFTGSNPPDAATRSFTVDGVTVNVTAGLFDSGSNPSNVVTSIFGIPTRQVDQNNQGLGADGPLDGGQIDGAFGNDVLVFSFSQAVRIDSISFGSVDGDDDFAFGSVDGTSFSRFVDFQDVANPVLASSFLSIAQREGNAFGIGAIGGGFFGFGADDFRVAGLQVTAVPVPPALLLLGSALLGFGFIRRRRTLEAASLQ